MSGWGGKERVGGSKTKFESGKSGEWRKRVVFLCISDSHRSYAYLKAEERLRSLSKLIFPSPFLPQKKRKILPPPAFFLRAAEELIFGASEVTTGAASDLETATRIARMMVTRWGFSDKLGPLVVKYGEEGSGPYGGDRVSGETRHLIEVEVKRIVTEAYDRAKKTLKVRTKR